MTALTRAQLGGIFENGDIPTASSFADLFDSFLNIAPGTSAQTIESDVAMRGSFAVCGSVNTFNTVRFAGNTGGSITFDRQVIVSGRWYFNSNGLTPVYFQSPINYSTEIVSAAGSAAAVATTISARFVAITGGAANQGVRTVISGGEPIIPSGGRAYTIFNRTANRLFCYPVSGASIDGLAADVPCTISASTALQLVYFSTTVAYTMRGVAML